MMNRLLQHQIGRRATFAAAGAGAMGLGLTGAGFGASNALAQEATPSPADPPGITPERVAAAVARLDDLAQQTLDETDIPGLAISVVYGDETLYSQGFGVREAGQEAPVDAETVFQMASLSKPVSSSVVAGVVGDGVVTWDSRIADHLPEFQMHVPWVTSQVTLRDMFCHRSGLPDHAGDLLEDLGFDRQQVLHRLRFIEPDSSFRSKYNYTNFGLTAAAVAAATAAGTDWEELAQRRLFAPLGMTHSSYRFADFIAQPNHAVGHMQIDGVWTAHEQRQPDAQAPAGGASTNVVDLARWMHMQLGAGAFEGEQIIATAALNQTHIPQIAREDPANPATDRTGFYGLGWNVGYTESGLVQLGHSGAFELGAATAVYLLPGEELGIVVLTNAQPIGAAETICLEFLSLAEYGDITVDYRTILSQAFAAMSVPDYGTEVDYLSPPQDATPALAAAAYEGLYTSDLYGDLTIAGEADGFVLRLGPDLTAYPLTHFNRDVFWYQPHGENAYGPSGVTFDVGPTGSASSVTIENLNEHGQGVFFRPAE